MRTHTELIESARLTPNESTFLGFLLGKATEVDIYLGNTTFPWLLSPPWHDQQMRPVSPDIQAARSILRGRCFGNLILNMAAIRIWIPESFEEAGKASVPYNPQREVLQKIEEVAELGVVQLAKMDSWYDNYEYSSITAMRRARLGGVNMREVQTLDVWWDEGIDYSVSTSLTRQYEDQSVRAIHTPEQILIIGPESFGAPQFPGDI